MPDLFSKHDSARVAIRLPLPPSANHHWRMFVIQKAPRMILSAAGREYIQAVARCWNSSRSATPWEPLTGPLKVTATIHYLDRRKIDLDNRMKPLLDALTKCGAWGDDSQIDELHVFRGPVAPPAGFCDVTIEAITP